MKLLLLVGEQRALEMLLLSLILNHKDDQALFKEKLQSQRLKDTSSHREISAEKPGPVLAIQFSSCSADGYCLLPPATQKKSFPECVKRLNISTEGQQRRDLEASKN